MPITPAHRLKLCLVAKIFFDRQKFLLIQEAKNLSVLPDGYKNGQKIKPSD